MGNQALLAGWDFDNILATSLPASPVRARYSDVYGNNSSSTALTAPGGIYFNGSFGSDNWGSVAKTGTGDINRDILTRTGSGSTFDLGGQTGQEGAANFNNASVGTAAMNEFSINLHMKDAVNSFQNLLLSLWGRDPANQGGATINWFYSIDGGVTKVGTGLTSAFLTNVYAESLVDFSAISALNDQTDIYLIGEVVEAAAGVTLNLDNIGAYAVAASGGAAPVINSALTATGTVGTGFTYSITATNTPTSFGATGLPSWATVNASTGVISGTPDAAATTNVSISATNGSGTDTETLVITINPAAPVINSATTATGQVGQSFSYTITATNSPTSFAATNLPAGLSVNTSTGVVSGTPTTAGVSTANISATNVTGTGNGTVQITINPPNPVITLPPTPPTGTVGSAFTYQIVASNNPTSYDATPLPAGLSVNTTSGVISGTPTTAGSTNVTVSATNAGGTVVASEPLVITISNPLPSAPVISSAATASGKVGQAFTYTITASNSPTSFAATNLPAGLAVNTSTGLISGTPTAAGVTTASISATNAGGTGNGSVQITIAPADPVITSALTATGQVGAAFTYSIVATNSPTSYGATGLPAGLSLNASTGAITGTPTTAATSNVTITATNAGGTDSETLVITINPAAPVISSALTASTQTGQAFTYTITASNSPTSFGATGLPAGLSVNTTSGLISGTPTTAAVTNVTISATNAGGTGTATLVLTVTDAPQPPTITSSLTATGQVGQAFTYSIVATNSPTSYGATGLPAGLAINATSGAITGTPTAAGTSDVSISATNAQGTDTETLVITINPATPVITSALTATGKVGQAFSYSIVATNSPTSYGATGLPAGLSLNATTGAITGTPTTASATPTNVTITATNAGGTDTETLAITINPPAPVVSAGNAGSVEGAVFTFQIVGTNTPTTYGATGLPAGLTVNATTGVISGTTTASGFYSIGISATNAGGTGNATLLLAVTAPVATSTATTKNLSGGGDNVTIGGFVIAGLNSKRMLLRVLGPELASQGITDAMVDPQLILYRGDGTVVGSNDDWHSGGAAAMRAIFTEALAANLPDGSKDAAYSATLPPGNYTIHAASVTNQPGTVVIEMYDLDDPALGMSSILVNSSSRGRLGAGGFLQAVLIVDGNDRSFLVRGVGPSLAGFGIEDAIADPLVRIYQGATLVGENDNWASSLGPIMTAIGAFPLTSALESALVLELDQGVYEARLSNTTGAAGVGLLEFYYVFD